MERKFKKLHSYDDCCKFVEAKDIVQSSQAFLAQCESLEVPTQAGVRSAVCTRPDRLSLTPRQLDTRLSKGKNEKLDYGHVLMKETDLEKAIRLQFIREVNQQGWVDAGPKTHSRGSLLYPSYLLRRKVSTTVHETNSNHCYKTSLTINPRPQYCNRSVHMDKGEFSKQFCDVLGPSLCADCTKSQMRQFVVDENTKDFPDICVSPYVLCTPQESEKKAKTSTQIEFDPLQQKVPSRTFPSRSKDGLKTRPNSCNRGNELFHNRVRFSPDGTTSDSPNQQQSPFSSSRCSSRRSSLPRYLTEYKNSTVLRTTESGSNVEETKNSISSIQALRISTEETSDDNNGSLERGRSIDKQDNNFKISRKANDLTARNGKKSRSISRAGKLSELPYYLKFLIPEPPMMEVERMNVSIYTPKKIPGIKIFDESFFDI